MAAIRFISLLAELARSSGSHLARLRLSAETRLSLFCSVLMSAKIDVRRRGCLLSLWKDDNWQIPAAGFSCSYRWKRHTVKPNFSKSELNIVLFLLCLALTCSCRWKCSIFKAFYLKHVSETREFFFFLLIGTFNLPVSFANIWVVQYGMSSVQYGLGSYEILIHISSHYTELFTSELGRCCQRTFRSTFADRCVTSAFRLKNTN